MHHRETTESKRGVRLWKGSNKSRDEPHRKNKCTDGVSACSALEREKAKETDLNNHNPKQRRRGWKRRKGGDARPPLMILKRRREHLFNRLPSLKPRALNPPNVFFFSANSTRTHKQQHTSVPKQNRVERRIVSMISHRTSLVSLGAADESDSLILTHAVDQQHPGVKRGSRSRWNIVRAHSFVCTSSLSLYPWCASHLDSIIKITTHARGRALQI